MVLKKSLLIPIFLVILFSLIVNLPVLFSGKTYYGVDANVGIIKSISDGIWSFSNYLWYNWYLLGLSTGTPFNLSILLGKFIGYDKVPVFDLILYMFVSFLGMYLFLRNSEVGLWGSIFGATSISLTTMGILSVMGGHIDGSISFLILALGIVKYVYSKDPKFLKLVILTFLAGVSLGIAFTDFQRTIYFGLVLGFYIIFLTLLKVGNVSQIVKLPRYELLKIISIPLFIFIVFVLFSLNTILGFSEYIGGVQQLGVSKEDPNSKWKFLVQFSYPPEEILNFFVPGMFGYFSGDKDLPYWGRAAQDFDYEKTKQGMKNFRLGIDAYTGVFVLPFILLSFVYFRSWSRERKYHFIFWLVVAVVAFLFSIARYFPTLFWLLIQIPYFDKFRVPAKWMDVFIIALVIMASFVFDSFVRNKGSKENKKFINYLFIYSGILLFAYIIVSSLVREIAFVLSSPSSIQLDYSTSQVASQNILNSIGNAFLFVFLGTLVLYVVNLVKSRLDEENFSKEGWFTDVLFLVFIFVVFINMYVIVKPMFKEVDPKKLYAETDIVKFLKQKMNENQSRIVMFSQLANHYYTFVLPYHNLETVQTIAQSRLPDDYSKLLPYVLSYNFPVMTKYGTRYLLTEIPPTNPQILQLPFLVYITNISSTIYLSEDNPSFYHSLYVYEISNSLPRFFVTPNYIKYNGEFETILMMPVEVLKSSVLLTNDIPNFSTSTNLSSSVIVEKYDGKSAKLKVYNSHPAFLVFNTYFHPKWECFVDGVKKEIYKANYLAQAVYLDREGDHIVEFKFNSFSYLSLIQFGFLILFIVFGIYAIFYNKKVS
ncbi:MAG: hypothetical protein ACPL4C_02180 [Brevinematia bacterium]